MNIVEYRTVSAISSKELDNAVNRCLKSFPTDWTPYVAGSGFTQSLYQALVRMEDATDQNSTPKKEEASAQAQRTPCCDAVNPRRVK